MPCVIDILYKSRLNLRGFIRRVTPNVVIQRGEARFELDIRTKSETSLRVMRIR